MPGKLSTHVLDLTTGRPAAGMKIELWKYGDEQSINLDGVLVNLHAHQDELRLIKSLTTNEDGRTNTALLEPPEMKIGTYVLGFFVRDYFGSRGIECPFLDMVPVRFSITDAGAGYHVPLLVSPWAYQTYRGS